MRLSRTLPIALMTMLPLLACSATTPETVARTCPVARDYTAAQQDQWAREVSATPKGSMYREVTDDYLTLRDEAKDCWNAGR